MKRIKRGLAVMLAILLMIPTQPALAAELPAANSVEKSEAVLEEMVPEDEPETEDFKDENEAEGEGSEDESEGETEAEEAEEGKDPTADESEAAEGEGSEDEGETEAGETEEDEDPAADESEAAEGEGSEDEGETEAGETEEDEDPAADESEAAEGEGSGDEGETEAGGTEGAEDPVVDESETAEGEGSEDEGETEAGETEEDEDPAADESEAAEGEGSEDEGEAEAGGTEGAENPAADEGEAAEEEEETEQVKPVPVATPSNAVEEYEEIRYNTGNYEVSVVSEEDFFENQVGDAYFEEDGSYTIMIPEENPFFPYEVQFTYDEKTVERWFMTPDDSVKIDGHTFYVDAYFDDSVITQMSLEVAGETVVVYPERKEFTDGSGAVPLSLLPLEERYLDVDLTGFTPVELTMVSIASIFAGETELSEDDKVMWTRRGTDDYTVSAPGETIDLSEHTSYGYGSWEMIVGDDNQLAGDNIRYLVNAEITESQDWLIPMVYKESEDEVRAQIEVLEDSGYGDNFIDGTRHMDIYVASDDLQSEEEAYVSLSVNPELYPETYYDSIKVYEGTFSAAEEAESAPGITERLFAKDMEESGSGYRISLYEEREVTFVTYQSGQVTGCLPVTLDLSGRGNSIFWSMYRLDEDGREYVTDSSSSSTKDGITTRIVTLEAGYPADGLYHLACEYNVAGKEDNSAVTAAYLGHYTSIMAAEAAGAAEIKEELFSSEKDGGYQADYSKGVDFTIFVGRDEEEKQEVYRYRIQTKETPLEGSAQLSGNTLVRFSGVRNAEGDIVSSYVVDADEDSYANYNYLTIFVEEDTDLTSLAPVFSVQEGLNLYTAGSSSPEVSGESVHDFSEGPVQYSVSAENKTDSANYWLKVLKAESAEGKLYINSLEDEDAETSEEDGTIYSAREVFIDSMHDDVHDILVANVGREALPGLSVELDSDTVELDDYWTLKGGYELSGLTTVHDNKSYGELPNLAKIRLKAKEGAEGQDASGTLTILSEGQALMILTLTGVVGDPMIITKEIPEAVKYVPYGTMIQNSNKYSWNKITYQLTKGTLPDGMELKENGEIYGVPTETGEFTFTVRMKNSNNQLASSTMTYTLIVNENTNANVDGATDQGYEVTQRIPDIHLSDTKDYTFVSEGTYGEFVDIFLDGEKLEAGVDYDSESGSTRITIQSQTLKASNKTGTHTLGVEFRTKDTNTLKRAAQNYKVTGSSSGSSDNDSGSYQNNSNSGTLWDQRDAKRGYMNDEKGIITGTGTGYSYWKQDEAGWKLIYADGTEACGHMTARPDGSEVEQIVWEKVNGSWYAFGTDGYLKSGWICDYEKSAWYYMTVESGMETGWHLDPEDGHWYYLDPATGAMAEGWRQCDGTWYYFYDKVTDAITWEFDEMTGTWVYNRLSQTKPYGSMYQDEITPDGYVVGKTGAWDGNAKLGPGYET